MDILEWENYKKKVENGHTRVRKHENKYRTDILEWENYRISIERIYYNEKTIK